MATEILVSAIDGLQVAQSEKDEIEKWVKRCASLTILLIGRRRNENSNLINAVIGDEVVTERRSLHRDIWQYSKDVESITVNVYDACDFHDWGMRDRDVARIKETCGNVDVVFYAIDIDDIFDGENNPVQKLTETFGSDWWENVVVVLTGAHEIEPEGETWLRRFLGNAKEEAIRERVSAWQARILGNISKVDQPKGIVLCVPAGDLMKLHLPGQKYWLCKLWSVFVIRTKWPSIPALFITNANRFKLSGDSDYEESLERDLWQSHSAPLFINEIRSFVGDILRSIGRACVRGVKYVGGWMEKVGGPVGFVGKYVCKGADAFAAKVGLIDKPSIEQAILTLYDLYKSRR